MFALDIGLVRPGCMFGPTQGAQDMEAAWHAFFIGTAAFAIPLMKAGGRLGWAAATILLGALLILAEILSAQVILSHIGNILAFCGAQPLLG